MNDMHSQYDIALTHDETKKLSRRLAIPAKKFPEVLTTIIPNLEQQKEFYETVELLVDTYVSKSNKILKYLFLGAAIAVIVIIGGLLLFKYH